MVHGGTSFGFMSGANFDSVYQPDVSSYDYDSPIDEAGRPTAKFHALREVIRKHLAGGRRIPCPSRAAPGHRDSDLPAQRVCRLRTAAARPHSFRTPADHGSHRASHTASSSTAPNVEQSARGLLEITQVHDYAVVLDGARRLGVVDRRLKRYGLGDRTRCGRDPRYSGGEHGPHRTSVPTWWTIARASRSASRSRARNSPAGKSTGSRSPISQRWPSRPSAKPAPAFHRGAFELETIGDTFLDLRGWGKGYVWVNGHNLGRYWRIGPQQSLFLPAPWLKKGQNEVVVLDLEETSQRSLSGHANAFWGNERS